ncbi:MAG: hypothetical protein IKW83_04625 [Muribaculaceae bacterium]|nr:hypothetical protein [Muribaculaceae bacterium]
MKKFFTLLAAAMLGVCAYAQTCPSEISLKLLDGTNPNLIQVEVMLTNASENLNGFNFELEKTEGSPVVFRKSGGNYFSAAGYANVILQRWETTMEEDEDTGDEIEVPVTDEMREAKLLNMCDVKSNLKQDNLVIIELLSTTECRFFPVLDEPTAIGVFYMRWPATKEDEAEVPQVTLSAPSTPSRYSFSYTGGAEGTVAMTPDAPIEYTLYNVDGVITDEVPQTAISTISTDTNVDNRIFDLQGRELQSVPEHGIYIQNGKKYVK